MKRGSFIALWVLSVFFIISSLVYLPNLCSVFMLLVAGFLLPVAKWQDIINKFFKNSWIKNTIIVVLVSIAFLTVPAPSNTENDLISNRSNDTGITDISKTEESRNIEKVDNETAGNTDSGDADNNSENFAFTQPEQEISEPTQTSEPESTTDPVFESPEDSFFTVHYIDVGQADSALVICDGKAMLIDGGNVADSNLIYSYLKKLNIDHLDYMVCTHAHEDHVGGLAGALNYAKVDKVFAPVTSYDSKAFSNFVKYLDKQSKSITMPSPGDEFLLGSAKVTVLGPIKATGETNNTSIVLRVVYGNTSFLFTGDAEREEEQDILNAGFTLSSSVLKVGHHGSETSSTYPFLREIMPQYAIISVGANNSYGHPTEATLSRLRDADVKVYRTDMQGDIICTSNGKSVSFLVEKNAEADTLSTITKNSSQDGSKAVAPKDTTTPSKETPIERDYVLNTNTKKFHYPSCSSVDAMKEENKGVYKGTREDVIDQGYSPCGRCKP